ncbi:hypothetical protein PAHAL_2G172700 [Panicum hallii]|uniref:Uncharacterized protein n=1 Tax=Panicum hallii TaxID=206008 RepID=A0A2T8KPC0_9POAL|nr:hypothetical protein PAHAL_2G172700 [Panicum hallii]
MDLKMVKLYSQRAWGGSAGGGADGLCELLLFSQRMPANTLLDMLLSRGLRCYRWQMPAIRSLQIVPVFLSANGSVLWLLIFAIEISGAWRC